MSFILKLTRIIFLGLFLFLTITISVFSQSQKVDIIYLKNGSSIQGTIIERKENKYIRIISLDDVEFTFHWYSIARIGDVEIRNVDVSGKTDVSVTNDEVVTPKANKNGSGSNITYGVSLGLSFENQRLLTDVDTKPVIAIPLSGYLNIGFEKVFIETGITYKRKGFKFDINSETYKLRDPVIIIPANFGFNISTESLELRPILGVYNGFHFGQSKIKDPNGDKTDTYADFYELGLNIGFGIGATISDRFLEGRILLTRSFLDNYISDFDISKYKSFEFVFIYHFVKP